MQLNKLSIELLANAFSAVEIASHFPFAVVGQEQTLKTLRKFLLAMGIAPKEGRITLWGCPLIQDVGTTAGCIVLGCHTERFIPLNHYSLITESVIEYHVGEPILRGDEVDECPEVWGLKIWLS